MFSYPCQYSRRLKTKTYLFLSVACAALVSTPAHAVTINANGTYTGSTPYDIGVDGITATIDANITTSDSPDGADGGPNNGGFGSILFDTNDHANLNITFAPGRTLQSGMGGDGGNGLNSAGGNGTRGGYALYLQGATNSTFNIGSTVIAGNGGNGGAGNGANNIGGNAGNGTSGAQISGANNTLIISGSLTGGNGGNGGNSAGTGLNGGAGQGGNGLSKGGANGTILVTSTGRLTGGNAGNPGANGSGAAGAVEDAGHGISITGFTDSLTIQQGAVLRGGSASNGAAVDGHAISIGSGIGTLSNAGILEGGETGNGRGVSLNAAVTTFENLSSGIIGLASGAGDGIFVNGSITSFSNAGLIRAGSGDGIDVTAGDTITNFTNSGSITSLSGSGILVSQQITNFNNSGTISSNTGMGLQVSNSINDFINTGTISSGSNVALRLGSGIDNTMMNTGGTITSGVTSLGSGTVNISTGVNGKFLTGGQLINSAGGNAIIITNGQTSDFTLHDIAITGNIAGGGGSQYYALTGSTTLNGNVELGTAANFLTLNNTMTGTDQMQLRATGGTLALTIGTAGNITLNSSQEAANNINTLVNNGRLAISGNKTLTVGTMSTGGAGNRWTFGLDAQNNTGKLVVTGGALDFTNSTIDINTQAGSGFIATGTDVLIADGLGAANLAGLDNKKLTDNSILLDFTLRRGDHASVTALGADNSNAYVEIERFALQELLAGTKNQNIGAVIEQIGTSGDDSLDAVQLQLQTASTVAAIDAILEQLAPPDTAPVVTATATLSNNIGNLVSDRLTVLRGAGAASDDLPNRAWLEAFGGWSDQGSRGGADGYETRNAGLTAGFDTGTLFDGGIIGLAVTYGDSTIKQHSINRPKTDSDSLIVTLYGDKALPQRSHVEAALSYGQGTNDTQRTVLGSKLTGDYDSTLINLRGKLGHTMRNDTGSFMVIPAVTASYTKIDTQAYTESGPAGLHIQGQDTDKFEIGLETTAKWSINRADGSKIEPSITAGYRVDMMDENGRTTSSFAGAPGSSAFTVSNVDAGAGTASLGAGVNFYSAGNIQVAAEYGLERKADYTAHQGRIRAGFRF